jgi:hypothetical protein
MASRTGLCSRNIPSDISSKPSEGNREGDVSGSSKTALGQSVAYMCLCMHVGAPHDSSGPCTAASEIYPGPLSCSSLYQSYASDEALDFPYGVSW